MSGPAVSAPPDQSGAAAGEQLRGERERRALTVQQVAETLHLDPWAIEAMEAGRFAALGPPVYCKGHLHKYAQLLGLDAQALCEQFSGKQVPDPGLAPLRPAMRGEKRKGRGAMLALVVLALVAAGALAWQFWPQRATTPAVEETPAAENLPVMAVVSTAAASQEPQKVPPPAVQSVELRLAFKADCWIEVYNAAGERLLLGTAPKGSERTVKGTAPLRVFVGNTDGVDLQANGKPLQVPAESIRGGVARFAVTADGTAARWVLNRPGLSQE